MSTFNYEKDLRGQFVTVNASDSIRVYSRPEEGGLTLEWIDGPVTIGTATGNTYTGGKNNLYKWIEVLRVLPGLILGLPNVSSVYVLSDNVTMKPNPAYDPAKDAPRTPETDGQVTDTKPVGESDGVQVYDKQVPGTVPVVGSDGKPVYVLMKDQPLSAATSTTAPSKWLTYGLYAVLGLSVIALIVLMVRSRPAAAPLKQAPKPASL